MFPVQLEDPEGVIDRTALDISIEAAQRIAEAVRKISALREITYQDYAGMRMLDLETSKQEAEGSRQLSLKSADCLLLPADCRLLKS